jgi:hypothetical protein
VWGEFDERKLNIFCNSCKLIKKWHPHNRNALCWSFYCVNDNLIVNLNVIQMMHCLLCHSQPIFLWIQKNN